MLRQTSGKNKFASRIPIMFGSIKRAITQAWRSLLHDRLSSAAAITVLAFAIGGVGALGTLVDQVVLHPLSLDGADQLAVVTGAATPPVGDRLAWWGRCSAFEGLTEYATGSISVSHGGISEREAAAVVSYNFFPVLRVRPQIGRTFAMGDETAGGIRPVAISDDLWTRSFGRNPAILGATLELDTVPYAVSAVMPKGFDFPGRTDLWVPRSGIGPGSLNAFGSHARGAPIPLTSATIARLRPGASVAGARSELNVLRNRLNDTYAKRTGAEYGNRVTIAPLNSVLAYDTRPTLMLLLTSAALLLVLASASSANLLLSRWTRKEQEIWVRLCLGATRLGIATQVIAESLMLALAGGGFGFSLAVWTVRLVRTQVVGIPILGLTSASANAPTLIFCLLLSIAVGALIAVVPAVRYMAFADATIGKGQGGRGNLTVRLRSLLVMIQVAVALLLVNGSFLALRSLRDLMRAEPGFQTSGVVSMDIALPKESYGQAGKAAIFYRRFLADSQAAQGVSSVGLVNKLPFGGESASNLFLDVNGKMAGGAQYFLCSANYFAAMGIPLLTGRTVSEDDKIGGHPVVVVNQALAEQFLGPNPIGRGIVLEGESGPREVVGIVGNVKFMALTDATKPQFYLPYTQPYRDGPVPLNISTAVRTMGPAPGIFGELRSRVPDIDKNVAPFNMTTADNLIDNSVSPARMRGFVLSSFGGLAMALAVLGVYGVVSYSVVARTREIGVRVSLGASPRSVLLMVLGQGMRLALAGVAIGFAVSLLFRKVIAGLLLGVGATYPAAAVVCAVGLIAAALLACAVPALTASRMQPASALRHE